MRIIVLSLLIVLQTTISLAEEKKDWSKFIYRELKYIEVFSELDVSVTGSAEKLGLNDKQLADFLVLRFKNNFAGIKFDRSLEPTYENGETDRDRARFGSISCTVWTVGETYPIAYHVQCRGGHVGNLDIWSGSGLGYGNKTNVPETVKETLNKFVEQFAITFFKVRDEM